MRFLQWEEVIQEIWKNHRGKAIGVILGLLFGIFTTIFGFWKTVFIAICIGIGYVLGKRADEKGSLQYLIERWFGD